MIIIVHLAPLIGNNHCLQQTLVIILIYGGKTKTTQKWRKKCQTIQNENIKCLVKFIYFIHFSSLHWQFKQKFDHENKCGIFAQGINSHMENDDGHCDSFRFLLDSLFHNHHLVSTLGLREYKIP